MKGYKGFNKGLICKCKQYSENTIFVESEAVIREKGMHFCKKPYDVLEFYPIVNGYDGELSEYANVEALAETVFEDESIYATTKLKIGNRLDIQSFVDEIIYFRNAEIKNIVTETTARIVSQNKDKTCVINIGSYSIATNTGDLSVARNKGVRSVATNTGYRGVAENDGVYSVSLADACESISVNRGKGSTTINCGYRGVSINTGLGGSVLNTGAYSAAISTGDCSAAINTGDISNTTTKGESTVAINTGYQSVATVERVNSVAITTGCNSKAKGAVGSAICICERGEWNGETYPLINIKAAIVDGEKIKPDTFYKLVDGEFVEV